MPGMAEKDKEKEGFEEWTRERVTGILSKLEKFLDQVEQSRPEREDEIPVPPEVKEESEEEKEQKTAEKNPLKALLDWLM